MTGVQTCALPIYRPARDASVAVPSPPERRNEREDDEGQRDERQHDVRNEHGKIKVPDDPLGGELGGSLTDVQVVSNVTGEKERRRDDCGNHAGDVPAPMPAADQIPAGRDENCTHEVERGVDRGQIRYFQEGQNVQRSTSNVQRSIPEGPMASHHVPLRANALCIETLDVGR